jgi:hypothetical protein
MLLRAAAVGVYPNQKGHDPSVQTQEVFQLPLHRFSVLAAICYHLQSTGAIFDSLSQLLDPRIFFIEGRSLAAQPPRSVIGLDLALKVFH